jgi:hypothetical protein
MDDDAMRDWFMGQALANPSICTGQASEAQLSIWFPGPGSGAITRFEIAAKQAERQADAMMKARSSVLGK